MADVYNLVADESGNVFDAVSASTSNSRSLPPVPLNEIRSKSRKKRLQKKINLSENENGVSNFERQIAEESLQSRVDISESTDRNRRGSRFSDSLKSLSESEHFLRGSKKSRSAVSLKSTPSLSHKFNNNDPNESDGSNSPRFESHELADLESRASSNKRNNDENRAFSTRPKVVKVQSNDEIEDSQFSPKRKHSTPKSRKSEFVAAANETSGYDTKSATQRNKKKESVTSSKRRKSNIKEQNLEIQQSPSRSGNVPHDLEDDDISVKNGLVLIPTLDIIENMPSEPVGKLFIEHSRGFKAVPKRCHSFAESSLVKSEETLEEFIQKSQKWFYSMCRFCHGLLAGLALWQCIVSYFLGPHMQDHDYMDFVQHYSPVAHIFQSLFYFLLSLCIICVFERYDVAHPRSPSVSCFLSFPYWILTLLVYPGTFAISLSISHLDDKLGLYQYNSTIWSTMDELEIKSTINYWQTFNWIRCIGALIGWIGIIISPVKNSNPQQKHFPFELKATLPPSHTITGPV